MSILRALSGLGAIAGGYVQGDRMKKRDEREEADQAYQDEQRGRMRQQWGREDTLRSDLAAAAQPQAVEAYNAPAEPIGVRDVAAPPAPTQYMTGGRSFADQGAAQQAATAANTPEAQAGRMSAAYSKAGDPMAAMKLRNEDVSGRAAQLNLDEAQRKHINQMFDDNLTPLTSHHDVADLINRTQVAGQTQVMVLPSADGKEVEYVKVNPDGSQVKTGQTFANDARGLLQAKEALSRAVPVEQKLATAHHLAQERISQQQADTMSGYRTDQAENFKAQRTMDARRLDLEQQRVNIEAKRANSAQGRETLSGKVAEMKKVLGRDPTESEILALGGLTPGKMASPMERMSEPDRRSYEGLLKQVEGIGNEIVKAQAGGMWDENAPNAKALRTQQAALNLKANAIMSRYAKESGAPDPLGLRGEGAAAAPGKAPPPIGGPQEKAEQPSVMGFIKDAGGRMARAAGSAISSAMAPSAQAAPSIPGPPPETTIDGKPNRAFAQWQQQYGAAWAQQQGAPAPLPDPAAQQRMQEYLRQRGGGARLGY